MYRIKEVMQEQGVTGKDLAEKMGVTPQYISGIVRGAGSASVEVLAKIAKILDVPLSSLFSDYTSEHAFKCPHCGKPIEVALLKKEVE